MATKNKKKTQSKKKPTPERRIRPNDLNDAEADREPIEIDPDSFGNQLIRFSFFAAALLFLIFLIFTNMSAGLDANTGPVGYGICWVLFGLLGRCAYLIPLACVYLGVVWRSSLIKNNIPIKIGAALLFLVLVASVFELPVQSSDSPVAFYQLTRLWNNGVIHRGGGLIGGIFGSLLYLMLKGVSWIILFFLLLIDAMLLSDVTPRAFLRFCKRLGRSFSAWMAERREADDRADREAKEPKSDKSSKKKKPSARKQPEPEPDPIPPREPADPRQRKRNIFGIEEEEPVEPEPQMEVQPVPMQKVPVTGKVTDPRNEITPPVYVDPNAKKTSEPSDIFGEADPEYDPFTPPSERKPIGKSSQSPLSDPVGAVDPYNGGSAADDDDDDDIAPWDNEPEELTPEEEEIADLLLNTTRTPVAEETIPEDAKKLYRFPPLTLLRQNTDSQALDYSEELRKKGEKLVATLKSFRVDTEIVNISHGPTITRYELAPKVGVRVRAIANLVDDIALNLETTGVRVEAPIPGKSAVGIEVPNKHPMTVYLRELLENPEFSQAKSKVTAALGMDVAGQPVFVDIAKMPHLLIAGATGMGKSVCINSLLVSLLYKASPDELKLILIDPKKVELNVYNKLPHLLVPVVNAPKKAAGSLSWAVGEMERRFELIEEVGVRDIKGYNEITANDPAKEFLPHIVIVIDELADLMMTAPDDVEESICRIAQKARAAGMHLIIGTQRPSVNVITGLIKANIPTRIAFTVTSQIDSRTIIDMAGAEKLIGRGDMLYSPVGAMKPIRIQGSFVSDKEVEAVCDFIRAQVGDGEYDNSVIEQIEKNAEQCGQKKKSGLPDAIDEDTGEVDPKFEEAVAVAMETGKVSTSLLQRRLSLGYGRAAKIIDRMEQCGIVGPQEGSKPRALLISPSDWDEIKMRQED